MKKKVIKSKHTPTVPPFPSYYTWTDEYGVAHEEVDREYKENEIVFNGDGSVCIPTSGYVQLARTLTPGKWRIEYVPCTNEVAADLAELLDGGLLDGHDLSGDIPTDMFYGIQICLSETLTDEQAAQVREHLTPCWEKKAK